MRARGNDYINRGKVNNLNDWFEFWKCRSGRPYIVSFPETRASLVPRPTLKGAERGSGAAGM